MFTGLIEDTGVLRGRTSRGPGYRVSIATELAPLELGESIAVNGACLTVAALFGSGFEADISLETSAKTTLGGLLLESKLNLERSLTLGDRLGGHLVSGHVDGIARVSALEIRGDAVRLVLTIPPRFLGYVAQKGSVALDGVSLTVNALTESGFEIMLIPHTLAVTNLAALKLGSELNFEVDLLARYVVRYLEHSGAAGVKSDAAGASNALQDAGLKSAPERGKIL